MLWNSCGLLPSKECYYSGLWLIFLSPFLLSLGNFDNFEFYLYANDSQIVTFLWDGYVYSEYIYIFMYICKHTLICLHYIFTYVGQGNLKFNAGKLSGTSTLDSIFSFSVLLVSIYLLIFACHTIQKKLTSLTSLYHLKF